MRTKIQFVCLAAFSFACQSEQPPQGVPAVPRAPSVAARDTTGLGAEADSVLDSRKEDSPNVMFTSRGDTVSNLDAVIVAADSSGTYAVEVYSLNSVPSVRVKREIGRAEDGRPIWSTRARSLFASTDSTQAAVRGCRIDKREDPFIFGIAAVYKSVPDWRPTRAWRFDRDSEALRELTPAGAICSLLLAGE